MLVRIRETAAMPPVSDALPAGASSDCSQGLPADQDAVCTEPSRAIHHTCMSVGTREMAAMPLDIDPLPAGTSGN
jgi:hypothetical protein